MAHRKAAKPATAATALADMALGYAARGLPVFPIFHVLPVGSRFVCSCSKLMHCRNPGKHPRARMVPNGLKDASADPKRIKHWWACAPEANIGIACSQRCVVLDVDPRHGGDDTLDQLEQQHGNLPSTWVSKTGGGGLHYFFKAEQEVRCSVGKLGGGLDVRGTGGYVVAPPSRHISGNAYAWAPGCAPGEAPLAAMPDWLVAATRTHVGGKAVAIPAATWRDLVRNGVVDGCRNTTIARLMGHLVRRNVDPLVALELVTAWNAVRCRPPLSENEVVGIAASIAERDDKRREARHG